MGTKRGIILNQKASSEYGKKVWYLVDEKNKIIERFSSKANAIKFKKKYPDELILKRLPKGKVL